MLKPNLEKAKPGDLIAFSTGSDWQENVGEDDAAPAKCPDGHSVRFYRMPSEEKKAKKKAAKKKTEKAA